MVLIIGDFKEEKIEDESPRLQHVQNSLSDAYDNSRIKTHIEKADRISTSCGTSPPREIVANTSNKIVNDLVTSDKLDSKTESIMIQRNDYKKTTSTGTSPPPQSISTQVLLKKYA